MIPAGTRVYFAVKPADLRRSFDGLAVLCAAELERDPSRGGLFVFVNKRRNQVRVLFRDPHGWCILAKRLDTGRFRSMQMKDGCFCWETDARALMSFLEDIDVSSRARRRSGETSTRITHLKIVQPELQ